MLSEINIERMPSYQMGVETGVEEGMVKGEEKTTRTIAERLLQEGCSIDLVVKATGLSPIELQKSNSFKA